MPKKMDYPPKPQRTASSEVLEKLRLAGIYGEEKRDPKEILQEFALKQENLLYSIKTKAETSSLAPHLKLQLRELLFPQAKEIINNLKSFEDFSIGNSDAIRKEIVSLEKVLNEITNITSGTVSPEKTASYIEQHRVYDVLRKGHAESVNNEIEELSFHAGILFKENTTAEAQTANEILKQINEFVENAKPLNIAEPEHIDYYQTYYGLYRKFQEALKNLEASSKTAVDETEQDPRERAHLHREKRAKEFAEKYGIQTTREELLQAEEVYAQEIKILYKGIRIPGKKVPKIVQDKYDNARLQWRSALSKSTANLDPTNPEEKKDITQAKILGVRDTVFRVENIRTQAKLEVADEKSKTAFGKIKKWSLFGAGSAIKTYNKGLEFVGGKVASLHEKFSKNGEFDREKAIKNYTRAARIVSGALIGTTLVSTSPLVPALAFLVACGRGTIGLVAGSGAGSLAGWIYKEHSSRDKERLSHSLRGRDITELEGIEDLNKEVSLYKRGNAKRIEQIQRTIESLTAAAVGGVATFGAGHALNSFFGDLPSVKAASSTIEASETSKAKAPEALNDSTSAEIRASLAKVVKELDALKSSLPNSTAIPNEAVSGDVVNADVASTPPVVPEGALTKPSVTETTSQAPAEILNTVHEGVTVEIQKGQGAETLFKNLQQELKAEYPEGSDRPANVQIILDRSPHVLAKSFGFYNETAGSRVMNVGDSLSVDTHGNVLFKDALGKGEAVTLLDHTAQIKPINLGGEFRSDSANAPELADTTSELQSQIESLQAQLRTLHTSNVASEIKSLQAQIASLQETNGANLDRNAQEILETARLNNEEYARHFGASVEESSTPSSAEIALQIESLQRQLASLNASASLQATVPPEPLVSAVTPATPAEAPQPISRAETPRYEAVGTSEVLQTFKNSHGVEINPTKPNMYAWRVPETKLVYPVFYGADDATRSAAVDEYIMKNPKVPYVLTTHTSTLTGITTLEKHVIGPFGKPTIELSLIKEGTDELLPIPDPKDFIPMTK